MPENEDPVRVQPVNLKLDIVSRFQPQRPCYDFLQGLKSETLWHCVVAVGDEIERTVLYAIRLIVVSAISEGFSSWVEGNLLRKVLSVAKSSGYSLLMGNAYDGSNSRLVLKRKE